MSRARVPKRSPIQILTGVFNMVWTFAHLNYIVSKIVISPVLLHGRETLSLRKEHKLIVLENEVLRRISGPKREEVRRGGKRLLRSFIICILLQILLE
jgi:hypothetical protein